MPVAVNCCVLPSGTVGLAGVTVMETSSAAVTVRVVEPLIPVAGSVAVIVVVPGARAVARPPVAIVATGVLELAQVTAPVMLAVESSE
ncbi:hypothetical protein ES703_93080 [subsurface metagenome]